MILIQAILIIAFIFVLLRFLSNPGSSQTQAWKKILGILLTLLAVVAILFPELSNDIAHVVGVGRGADLLLYLLTIAFIFTCVGIYIRAKQEQNTITKLIRKIAILEANQNKHK